MIADIPIQSGQEAAILTGDETGLKGHHGALFDVYVDSLGIVSRRPGLTEFVDLATDASIDGIFWWEKENWVLAVSNGNAYKITDSAGTFSEISHDDTDYAKGGRIIFADFKTSIYTADRHKIKKVPNSGNVADMSDSSAPTAVSHVAALDTYLLANNIDSNECHRSDVGDADTWGSNYVTTETRNDDLRSVISANQELYLLGDQSLEIFYDDGSTPFIRESGGFIQSGTMADYSFGYCDTPINTLAWLDHERNPVMINGRNTVVMAGTMARYIQGFSYVTDCRGDYTFFDGRPYYIFSFPTENKTLVYDFNSKLWYEWAWWNETRAEYERWRGNCYCSATAWDFALVGDRNNGKIYKVDNTAYTDDSDIIRSLIRTGKIVHKYPAVRKKCIGIYIRVKRSALASGTVTLLVRYRNDGKTAWSAWKELDLTQSTGTTESIIKYRKPLGVYYNRQWEFVVTDNIGFSIAGVQEEFEYL